MCPGRSSCSCAECCWLYKNCQAPQQEHWNSIGMNWKDGKKKGNETMDQDKSFKSSYMKGKREIG